VKPISPLLDNRTLVNLKSGNIASTVRNAELRDKNSLLNQKRPLVRPSEKDAVVGKQEDFTASIPHNTSNKFIGDNVGAGKTNMSTTKPVFQSKTITETKNNLAFTNQNAMSGVVSNPVNVEVKATEQKPVVAVAPYIPLTVKTLPAEATTANADLNVATAGVTATGKSSMLILAVAAVALIIILKG